MPGDWRLAKSLEQLLHETNAKAPNRSKASDGTIGDIRHQQEHSDHNPNAQGVVCALDITQDPANGADMGPISELLVQRKHPTLKYVIFNRRINGRHTNWVWQDYHGSDPHTNHLHVSVGTGEDGQSTEPYDDVTPWGVADANTPPPPPPGPGQFHTWGTDVRVHSKPSVHSEIVRTLPGPTPIHVTFQVHAEEVVANGFTNNAWAFVPDLGGFLSNIYIDVPAPWLPGVPEGGQAPPPPPPPGPRPGEFHTWGADVRVHSKPSVHSEVVRTLPGPTPIHVAYQVHAEEVVADGFRNNTWAFVPDLGGFLSNIYIDVHDPWLPGVPEGGQAPPPGPGPQPGPPAPPPAHPQPGPGDFTTWGHDVRVHSQPSTQSDVVRTLDGPTPIHVDFQVHGEDVQSSGYRNNAWAHIPAFNGFLSNIYINTPQPWLPGVPEGGGGPVPPPPPPPGSLPSVHGLNQARMQNAKIIVQVGEQHQIPERGIIIALATALQESTLDNVNHGDGPGPDSRGLFQQRDNWGSESDRMNPARAAELFYGVAPGRGPRGLMEVPGWQNMSLTQAAQAVQVSGTPNAYAQHEGVATDLYNALK